MGVEAQLRPPLGVYSLVSGVQQVWHGDGFGPGGVMDGGAVAEWDWYLRARVRVITALRTSAGRGLVIRPPRYWRVGEEAEVFQWGRAGQPIEHTDWWTTRDADAAYILPADAVRVIEILDRSHDRADID